MIVYALQPWPRRRYMRYRAPHACCFNAQTLWWDHPDELTLVKGYALAPSFMVWVGHWWCVDAESRVVDPTWANAGRAYIGLEDVDPIEHVVVGLELPRVPPPELLPALDELSCRLPRQPAR